MTTVMSVSNSAGTRRCDARCHMASEKRCGCVCGGRYHGCGSSEIAADVKRLAAFGGDVAQLANDVKRLAAPGFRLLVSGTGVGEGVPV